jgi:hypothetical protein
MGQFGRHHLPCLRLLPAQPKVLHDLLRGQRGEPVGLGQQGCHRPERIILGHRTPPSSMEREGRWRRSTVDAQFYTLLSQ